jgi:hypothetical protein
LQEGLASLHCFMTFYAVCLSRAPMVTAQLREAKYLTVSAPMPELPPVTTAVLPERSSFFCL